MPKEIPGQGVERLWGRVLDLELQTRQKTNWHRRPVALSRHLTLLGRLCNNRIENMVYLMRVRARLSISGTWAKPYDSKEQRTWFLRRKIVEFKT